MALAALEAGVVSPHDTVHCAGFTQLGNRRFHCWKHGGHGSVDLRRSLAQSCDCYYYEMGRRLGPDRDQRRWRTASASASRHDLPMPAVSAGNMPDAAWKKTNRNEAWTTGDSFNYGIGQGFTLASPLQLALMVARVASGTRAEAPPPPCDRRRAASRSRPPEPLGIARAHLRAVRDGMYAVSNEGTAYRSRIVDPTMTHGRQDRHQPGPHHHRRRARRRRHQERAAAVEAPRPRALRLLRALRPRRATPSPRSSSTAAAARRSPPRSPATSCSTRSTAACRR